MRSILSIMTALILATLTTQVSAQELAGLINDKKVVEAEITSHSTELAEKQRALNIATAGRDINQAIYDAWLLLDDEVDPSSDFQEVISAHETLLAEIEELQNDIVALQQAGEVAREELAELNTAINAAAMADPAVVATLAATLEKAEAEAYAASLHAQLTAAQDHIATVEMERDAAYTEMAETCELNGQSMNRTCSGDAFRAAIMWHETTQVASNEE